MPVCLGSLKAIYLRRPLKRLLGTQSDTAGPHSLSPSSNIASCR